MAERQPIIVSVDDDQQVLRAIGRDLKSRYRSDYRIISSDSAREVLDTLRELRNKGEEVALFISDQRMPEMEGVEFLEKARDIYPDAKRVLLTAYSDTNAAIKAINDVQLDYYLMKPWDPPDEKLFPVIDDLLADWQAGYIPPYIGLRVVGYQFSPKSHAVKDFLAGNLFPYQWLDIETSQDARELLEINGIDRKDLPAIFFEDGSYVCDPLIPEIAGKLGLNPKASSDLYDVVIIGAGPSGLAAAVYGASEGLKTLLIEKRAPGGQAGTSSRIENYLGFPTGLSGADLARRAITQATRFGAEFLSPQEVRKVALKDQYKIVTLGDGTEIATRSIIITTGVDYRKLDTKGTENYTGAGVYYGAATTEAVACREKDVYVVGGGNSAGQAAMYLSKFARNVFIVIRREDLTSTMSAYLIDQITRTNNITVLPCTEITEVCGSDKLEKVVLENMQTREKRDASAAAVFVFIGARPYTEWIELDIFKDDKGYIETGRDILRHHQYAAVWKLQRDPYLLETCVPGIFAAGDVRSGAMNRVASAVGEGSMAISFVHKYLAEV